jgi:hypothetical protein
MRNIFFMAAGALLNAQSVPTQLTVIGATATQVQLRWQGNSDAYTVERKTGTAQWTALPAANAAALTDTAIDAMSTYTYRVRTGRAPALSAPSNEVVVGPPPAGHHVIVPLPKGQEQGDFAQHPQMTRDGNGDPAIAYSAGVPAQLKVYFIAWDRAHYRWLAPVQVAELGEGNSTIPFGLAYDASANRWAVAFRTRNDAELRLAFSTDNGVTWNAQTVATGKDGDFHDVALAASAGKVYLAVRSDRDLLYWSGDGSKDPAQWPRVTAPAPHEDGFTGGFGLALDPDGRPALAVIARTGDGIEPYFWRPGGKMAPIAKTPSGGPDDPNIQLSFAGTRAWIAFYGKADEKFFSDNHIIWVATSTDGTSWSPLVWVPNDGGQAFASEMNIATGSKGQGVFTSGGGSGNRDGSKCGQPLTARSPDLSRWTACGPSSMTENISANATSVMFASNDKLYIAYQSRGGDGKITAGLVLWREP